VQQYSHTRCTAYEYLSVPIHTGYYSGVLVISCFEHQTRNKVNISTVKRYANVTVIHREFKLAYWNVIDSSPFSIASFCL